ncbi:S8 family serine peptidase, partial [Microcystis aeruginosa]|uniref:S8 family serine peptidase n=1 Tax=Microcystis aeruginosa TaxID=1126 RepID=UPI001C99C545
MPSPEDSLSFERPFPITDGLRGSGDLSGAIETNSNPSPSTVSSEAPTVPPSVSVSPAAKSSPLFPASLSINSSRYSTSPALGLTSLPTAASVTSELKPAATSTLAPHAPNQLIVKFNQGIATAQVAQFHSLFGAVSTQKIKLTGAEIWKLSGSLSVDTILAEYGSNPIFEYIQPDYILTKGTISPQATFPNDPSFNQLWGLHNTGQSGGTADADIDAPEAWDIQTGDPNLVIGVVDTGVDYNHPDLAGNIWTNPGEIANDGIDNDGNGYIDDIRGWDFAYNDNDPSDVDGHGTHVAGTIAGKGNNGVGVTGVAWNAKIMPLKFLNDQGSGSTSNAILAINYATDKGVKLTNNSWVGDGYSQALYNAINAAGQAGALFIAAAGNDSLNIDVSPHYPSSYNLANIISVAATNRNDQLVTFDNTGAGSGSNYGLTSVDLGAPGSDIYSLAPGGGYATLSGTSMASSHVAGAAALLWSQNPTWTAQQVKNTLMNTGDSIAALAGKTVSGKRLNVFNALAAANLPSVSVSVSPTSVQEDGTTNLVYTFTRTNLNLSSPLTVNFGASGIANAAPVRSDPADYNVLTGSGVTFDPTTKLGTVTFAPGATTATVEVDPIADTIAEIANETVALTVNSGTGYIGGSPGTATGTIVSEETLPIFSNPNPITIPDSGTSSPYPSTINVSGLSGNINSLKVTLTNLSHTWPDDIDVLLVGPTGAKALLMSDVGGSDDVSNVTLTFEPTATSFLPDEGLITSGSYKATDFETGDIFNSPTPGGPYGTDFSVFNNTNPNGTWSLYVVDDAGGDVGTIAGGWSLLIGTAATVSVSVSPTSVQEDGTTNLVYTFTRTNLNLSSPLTVNFGASGIANAAPVGSDPADYNVLTGSGVTFDPTTKLGTVTFAPGATTATVEVDPIADTIAEIANETVALTVNSGTGYIGGSPGTATGTIVSEETLPIFSNPNPITIPDSGTSSPYPSTINVSGLSGNINSLKVTLTNLSHTWPDDIDVLLVGPTGAKALLMSDVGGSDDVSNVTLTFEPTATSFLPDEGLITSGSYKATDFETGDIFNSPTPGGPYGTDFSVFNNTNPNGTWSLYVVDDAGGDVGTIAGGWSLLIGTAAATKSISIAKTTDGNEAGSASNVFTLTRTGDLSSALTVNYTLTGTATPGLDYTGTTPNSVTFAAFSPTATITLPTIDDLLSDPGETIITTITAPAGYTISGPDTATATILDNDGNAANNNLVGTSFADALAGVGGNDTLDGGVGNDTLDGGVGNDTLDGGVGVDSMDGGVGNDTYFVDNSGDIVKEVFDDDLGGTADTIFASVTYSLAPGTPDKQGYGIENLTLTGSADINATGNDKNNVLTGNSGNNVLDGGVGVDSMDGGDGSDTLFGGLGSDTLDGGLGDDTLDGGADNDTYLFDTDVVLGSDRLIDASGIDTLNFAATTTKIINLNLGSTAAQTVTAGNLTLTLASATAFDNVIGGSLNDTIVGNSLANSLTGEAGNDSLTGGFCSDTLDGGLGDDTLDGGADNDTYLFDTDVVLGSDRLIDASGIDTLNFAATTTKTINLNLGSTAAQTVTAGNLTLTLASATAFENVIGGSLNDTIVGNSLANSLTGEAGNDSLTGGLGKDILTGSDGLDTLNYNSLGESLLSGFDVIQGYNGTGASLDSINA